MVWKIYFWLLSVLIVLAYALIFSVSPSISDLLDVIISLVALTGLYCYAYKYKLLSAKFWRTWLCVILVWDVIYNIFLTHYLGVAQQLTVGASESTLLEILFGYLFFVPEYIALYLLGFRSSDLWARTDT